MNDNAHFRMRPRTIIFIVTGVVLTWLVVSRSLAAFLADAAPQASLWFDSEQPEALVNLADRAVNNPVATVESSGSADGATPRPEDAIERPRQGLARATKYIQDLGYAFSAFESLGRNQSMSRPAAPENASTVRSWIETAIANDPLNARALRILGQLAEAASDDADASKFMTAADRLSLHEAGATYWLLRNSAKASDYKSAIYYADIMLRTNPRSGAYVVPVLAQISEDKPGAASIEATLANNPPWRGVFISALPNNVTDARTPLTLLLDLRNSPTPPTTNEIKPYLDLLVAHKYYGLAYYTWLQFLPPTELRHAGLLYNGNFEAAPSGLPFDWNITRGAGVTIDVVPRSDKSDAHALLVDFQYGRVDYHSVTQLVMLAPGSYEFKGEYKGELAGPRGMKWRVVCANGSMTNGGESPMITGQAKDWKTVAFTFTVPNKDCSAQYVRLDLDARMASEQLITGSILFDGLQISHVAGPPTGG